MMKLTVKLIFHYLHVCNNKNVLVVSVYILIFIPIIYNPYSIIFVIFMMDFSLPIRR